MGPRQGEQTSGPSAFPPTPPAQEILAFALSEDQEKAAVELLAEPAKLAETQEKLRARRQELLRDEFVAAAAESAAKRQKRAGAGGECSGTVAVSTDAPKSPIDAAGAKIAALSAAKAEAARVQGLVETAGKGVGKGSGPEGTDRYKPM